VGTADLPLSAQGQAAIDAVRRLPTPEQTTILMALAVELLGSGDGPQAAQDAPGATIFPDGGPTPGGWSKPASLTHWADRFDVSRTTLRRRIRDGTVRACPFGKLWRLAADSLPPAR
jgi:hypothetical protein